MTDRYTYEMTRLAIVIAILAAMFAFLLPSQVKAKAKGDTVGAPVKEQTTGASRADMAEATMPPAFFYSVENATTTATSTKALTKKEKREQIKALKKEIKRLQKILKELKKGV